MDKIKEKKVTSNSQSFHDCFIELMADELVQLPLREDEDYYNTLKQLYNYYLKRVSSFLSEKQLKVINNICESILKMINEFNDDAYKSFERLMNYNIFRENLHIIQDKLPVDGYGRTNINLFRLRTIKDTKVYKKKDIFHDPKNTYFDKNRKPYRYNLEDRPSLYLASTVYCCHKELGGNADKQNMIGSLYRLAPIIDKELYIIDIANRPVDFIKNKNKYKKPNIGYSENSYLFIYPLIAACSVVVPNKNKRNILEYKVTNLLYKWLVNNHNNQLCGIRYFSCHDYFYSITDKDDKLTFEKTSKKSYTKYFINYVFPISREVDYLGYCCKLKKAFLVSNPKYLREYGSIKEFEKDIKNITKLSRIDE